MADGAGSYANPGAWMDGPTFLRIVPERVELVRMSDGGDERLGAIDRR